MQHMLSIWRRYLELGNWAQSAFPWLVCNAATGIAVWAPVRLRAPPAHGHLLLAAMPSGSSRGPAPLVPPVLATFPGPVEVMRAQAAQSWNTALEVRTLEAEVRQFAEQEEARAARLDRDAWQLQLRLDMMANPSHNPERER